MRVYGFEGRKRREEKQCSSCERNSVKNLIFCCFLDFLLVLFSISTQVNSSVLGSSGISTVKFLKSPLSFFFLTRKIKNSFFSCKNEWLDDVCHKRKLVGSLMMQ
ncbi:hypothetical protein ACB098_02G026300 [Castanea mollissima]